MSNTVLLLEDDVVLRRSITQSILLEDMEFIVASSFDIAADHITKAFDGVVLTDIQMQGKDGFDVLKHVQKVDSGLPVIMITGHGDIAMAVRAMQLGAFDFLEKPCHPDHLTRVLKKALNQRSLVMKVRHLEKQVKNNDPCELAFPGTSSPISLFREELHKLAQLPTDIHIWGEFGSGRLAAAKCIHKLSATPAVIEEYNLPECDHETFKSLTHQSDPKFLIFRNVDQASEDVQEKLASLIDSVHGQRVITTSKDELSICLKQGLTKNLYYKMSVAQLEVPALHARPEDVLPTFHSVLKQQADAMQVPIPDIGPEKLSRISARIWDGNIAEIRQYVRKVLLALDDKSEHFQGQSLAERMKAHEKSIFEEALKRHKGQTASVADELSIPVKTLYDRLARHGLKSSHFR